MTEDNEQQMEQLFHDHYERMYRLSGKILGSFFSFIVFCIFAL